MAVSGGADSIALLHALHEWAPRFKWRLTVGHLHHGIRGRAADADAAFVQQTAARLAIPCVAGKARVPALARRRGISLEMAAREARYAFLARTARKVAADVIATAHTADDQAETLLLKLVRGTGPAGMAGIPCETTVKGCRVVRPLLTVSRTRILHYLQQAKHLWREDESNADPAFLRNRVRHELLPLLERDFNPRIREALVRMSRIFSAEGEWLEELTRSLLEVCTPPAVAIPPNSLACGPFQALPLAARRRVVRLWLTRLGAPESGLEFETVERIVALCERRQGSATVTLGEGWRVRRNYARLTLDLPGGGPQDAFRVEVRVPGVTSLPEQGLRVVTRLVPGLVKERSLCPGRLPARASFEASAWKGRPLFVRSGKPGDRMVPFGLQGSKKIQDILVDGKVPREERCRVPLFECEQEVIWLPGYRVAGTWAVKEAKGVNLQIAVKRLRGRKR